MTNGELIERLFPNVGTNFSNVLDLRLWWNAKYRATSEIHCNCTDEEIAKSFIEDVKAVEDLLPQREIELLTDKEQRIFLKAINREREVCQKVDDEYADDDSKVSLVKVCNSIERKVKKIWE